MKWSVLDQSPSSAGSMQDVAIRESIALAQHCDALGYERYWVSEHHNSASIVGTAPEILIAAVAATTRRIRVGSAGVMLSHYSALKVAEQFRVLEAIAPDRIDLGVGRAPGSDGLTARALNPHSRGAEEFPRQVQGDAAQVADKLRALGRKLELDEIVINTWTFDAAARRHSYRLLAEVFGLTSVATHLP